MNLFLSHPGLAWALVVACQAAALALAVRLCRRGAEAGDAPAAVLRA